MNQMNSLTRSRLRWASGSALLLIVAVLVVAVAGVDLIGLSMGGYVALAFAQRYPDQVRTLALLDTKASADTAEAKAGRDVAASLVAREGRAVFANSLIDALVAEQASRWVRSRIRTMIESTPAATAARKGTNSTVSRRSRSTPTTGRSW